MAKNKTSGKPLNSWENRRAHFEIQVEYTLTAGLILTGDEVKSIRAHRVQLNDSYVKFLGTGRKGGSMAIGYPVVVGLHLALATDPARTRPLLLHRKEIQELAAALQSKGKTAVPLKLWLKNGWAKLEIRVGSGRKLYQKRELLRQRDVARQQDIELKRSGR